MPKNLRTNQADPKNVVLIKIKCIVNILPKIASDCRTLFDLLDHPKTINEETMNDLAERFLICIKSFILSKIVVPLNFLLKYPKI